MSTWNSISPSSPHSGFALRGSWPFFKIGVEMTCVEEQGSFLPKGSCNLPLIALPS